MSPTKLEVPLKLDTLAAKMGPPQRQKTPPNTHHHQWQPGATTSAIFSGGSGCSWGCERASERAMHHDSCSTKSPRSCSSASASSHSIGRQISNKSQIQQRSQSNLANQWKQSAVPPNLAPLQVLYQTRRRRRRRRSHGKSPAPRDKKGSSSRRERKSCTCPRSIEHSLNRSTRGSGVFFPSGLFGGFFFFF